MATRTILHEAVKRHSSDIGEGSIHVIYMMATRSLSTVMMKMAMIGAGDLKVDSPVLDYDHQVEALTEAGFALWDVVTNNLGIFWLDQNVGRYTFIKFPEFSLAMQCTDLLFK